MQVHGTWYKRIYNSIHMEIVQYKKRYTKTKLWVNNKIKYK